VARPPLAYIAALDHDRSRIYCRGNAVANIGTTPWQLRDSERMIVGNAELLAQQHFLIGITRVRNEALILGDTLARSKLNYKVPFWPRLRSRY
jgi:hypothetical protein